MSPFPVSVVCLSVTLMYCAKTATPIVIQPTTDCTPEKVVFVCQIWKRYVKGTPHGVLSGLRVDICDTVFATVRQVAAQLIGFKTPK